MGHLRAEGNQTRLSRVLTALEANAERLVLVDQGEHQKCLRHIILNNSGLKVVHQSFEYDLVVDDFPEGLDFLLGELVAIERAAILFERGLEQETGGKRLFLGIFVFEEHLVDLIVFHNGVHFNEVGKKSASVFDVLAQKVVSADHF